MNSIFRRSRHWPSRISRLASCRCRARPSRNRTWSARSTHVRDAAEKGAEIVCLPELFLTQYFCQREDIALFDLAEPIPGPTTEAPWRTRARAEGHDRSLRCSSGAPPGIYHNTAAILDADGKLAGIYRKMHIPDDPLYYEKFYFTPGDLGFKLSRPTFGKSARWSAGTSGIPKGARLTALQGANVLFYPTAIGWHPDEKARVRRGAARCLADDPARARHRQRRLCRRCQIASASRTATFAATKRQGKGLEFWGGSFIADPFGRVIAQASHDKEEILIGEVRSRAHGRVAPQLAVPARPPHRCVCADHAAVSDDPEPADSAQTNRGAHEPWPARILLAFRKVVPAALGYRMPAEWEPHAATWIAWPHNRTDWPGKFEPIPWVYAEIVRHLCARRAGEHPGRRRAAEAKARKCWCARMCSREGLGPR